MNECFHGLSKHKCPDCEWTRDPLPSSIIVWIVQGLLLGAGVAWLVLSMWVIVKMLIAAGGG